MLRATLRAAAAGRMSMALMRRSPTHWMASMTTTAITTTKRLSSRPTGRPLLLAREALMLTAWN